MPATVPRSPFLLPSAGLAATSRRSFLRYSGASAALGSLWLASCKKDDSSPAVPSIASLTPASGMPGTTVTITGTNLTGATSVLLGTVAATFTVVSATSLTFVVPATAQTAALTVVTPGGTATSGTFTVLPTPSTAPTIASFAPTSALPGATVTVTGTNLAGATSLTLNGTAATPTVVNTTTLTFVVPLAAVAGAATIVITGPGGMGTSMGLTVLPTTVNVGSGDLGVLNYAYGLEQLEAAFYANVLKGSYFSSASAAEKQVLTDLALHEKIHADFFKTTLGTNAIPTLTADFSMIDFSDRSNVLAAAQALEDLGVAAYNGVARFLTSVDYLTLAGKIVSVEARHAALIRDLFSYNSFVAKDIVDSTTRLELSKTPTQVVAIANIYLAIGSKLDVSKLG